MLSSYPAAYGLLSLKASHRLVPGRAFECLTFSLSYCVRAIGVGPSVWSQTCLVALVVWFLARAIRDSMRKLTGNYWSATFCVIFVSVAMKSVK